MDRQTDRQTDGQTDKQTDRHRPSTVTLAAHARRGLMKSTDVQTLGAVTHANNDKTHMCVS